MRLYWNESLQDPTKIEKEINRIYTLCSRDKKTASDRPSEELLNHTEMLLDLVRYYYLHQNMTSLEWSMREMNACIKQYEGKYSDGTGIFYLKMEFYFIDGMLYRDAQNIKEAEESLSESIDYARKCVKEAEKSNLSDHQILYVGMRCLEIYRTYLMLTDIMQNPIDTDKLFSEILETIQWMEEYMFWLPDVADVISDFYYIIGSQMNLQGKYEACMEYIKRAGSILDELYRRHQDVTVYSKKLWVNVQLCLLESSIGIDRGRELLHLEEEAEKLLLDNNTLILYQRGVLNGVVGNIEFQKALYFQQQDNLQQALLLTEKSCDKLKEAFTALDNERSNQDNDGQVRWLAGRMALQIYGSYIAAMNLYGGQLYFTERFQEALNTYESIYALVNDTSKYRLGESMVLLLRAESGEHLADIYRRRNDLQQAEFYGKQAADTAYQMFYQNKVNVACGILVSSAAFLADLYMNDNNKEEALRYADIGLEACKRLLKIDPESGKLGLMNMLQKIEKKASKRGLFF